MDSNLALLGGAKPREGKSGPQGHTAAAGRAGPGLYRAAPVPASLPPTRYFSPHRQIGKPRLEGVGLGVSDLEGDVIQEGLDPLSTKDNPELRLPWPPELGDCGVHTAPGHGGTGGFIKDA